MMARRFWALSRMERPKKRCSSLSSLSSIRSVMPRTPFIGVRISWLMLARKSLLARLAASASLVRVTSSRFMASTPWVYCRRRWSRTTTSQRIISRAPVTTTPKSTSMVRCR